MKNDIFIKSLLNEDDKRVQSADLVLMQRFWHTRCSPSSQSCKWEHFLRLFSSFRWSVDQFGCYQSLPPPPSAPEYKDFIRQLVFHLDTFNFLRFFSHKDASNFHHKRLNIVQMSTRRFFGEVQRVKPRLIFFLEMKLLNKF